MKEQKRKGTARPDLQRPSQGEAKEGEAREQLASRQTSRSSQRQKEKGALALFGRPRPEV